MINRILIPSILKNVNVTNYLICFSKRVAFMFTHRPLLYNYPTTYNSLYAYKKS